jgi:hypothetical protein
MTEFGDVEGACAESTEAIAANVRVAILEARDRIGVSSLGRMDCGGRLWRPPLRVKVYAIRLNGGAPLPGNVCKVFIAGVLVLDFDSEAVVKSLQSGPRLVKSSFLWVKSKKPRPFGSGFRFSFLLFLL